MADANILVAVDAPWVDQVYIIVLVQFLNSLKLI